MTAEPEVRKHFYRGVLRLGNVAVSRHAQARMIAEGVTQEAFDRALLTPTHPDVWDGADVLWRERDGLRIVIVTNPTPNVGANLVTTVYRVERQARARLGMKRRRCTQCRRHPPAPGQGSSGCKNRYWQENRPTYAELPEWQRKRHIATLESMCGPAGSGLNLASNAGQPG